MNLFNLNDGRTTGSMVVTSSSTASGSTAFSIFTIGAEGDTTGLTTTKFSLGTSVSITTSRSIAGGMISNSSFTPTATASSSSTTGATILPSEITGPETGSSLAIASFEMGSEGAVAPLYPKLELVQRAVQPVG